MIYVDSSVVLAELLGEDRRPPLEMWAETLVASRLVTYEVWNRVHARGLMASHGEATRDLLSRLALVELSAPVLERALEPFLEPVRTLDALHLATLSFLRGARQPVELATYDARLRRAAERLEFAVSNL
jgi:predicted nucleic acid-binding protein